MVTDNVPAGEGKVKSGRRRSRAECSGQRWSRNERDEGYGECSGCQWPHAAVNYGAGVSVACACLSGLVSDLR